MRLFLSNFETTVQKLYGIKIDINEMQHNNFVIGIIFILF